MKSLSLPMFLTVVYFSITSLAADNFTVCPNKDEVPYEGTCITRDARDQFIKAKLESPLLTSCRAEKKEFDKAQTEFINACSKLKSGDDKCIEVAKMCADTDSQSQPQSTLAGVGASMMGINGSDYNSNCHAKDLTATEYRDEKKSAEDKKRDKEKDLKDLVEKLEKAKKEMVSDEKDLKSKTSDFDDAYAKQKVDDQKNDEAEQRQLTEQVRSTQAQMRSLQQNQANNFINKTKAQQDHASRMMKLADSIQQAECSERIRKIMGSPTNSSSTIINGGIGSAMSASNSRGSIGNAAWSDCIEEFSKAREAEMEIYSAGMASFDVQDQNLRSDYAALSKGAADLNKQMMTAATRNQQAGAQKYSLYLQKRIALLDGYTKNLQANQQMIQKLEFQSMQLTNEVASADNALNTLSRNRPKSRDKTISDALPLATSLFQLKKRVQSSCQCDSQPKDKGEVKTICDDVESATSLAKKVGGFKDENSLGAE